MNTSLNESNLLSRELIFIDILTSFVLQVFPIYYPYRYFVCCSRLSKRKNFLKPDLEY